MNSALVHTCFRRLFPHVDGEQIALTGGVAIDLHLGPLRRTRDGGSGVLLNGLRGWSGMACGHWPSGR